MKEDLEEIMQTVINNYDFHEKNKGAIVEGITGSKGQNWWNPNYYLKSIAEEVEEVSEELKKDNSVHLEDELTDILWSYLSLVYMLEKKGYIKDLRSVIKRCNNKFSERITGKLSGIKWNDIKKKQKERLKKEHNLKYNNN